MGEDCILETNGLVKEFRGFVAVNGVDLKVRRGHIHALIGPNGAGKTTLIRSIVGLTQPDGGEIRVFGLPAGETRAYASRQLIGYSPQEVSLDRFVSVRRLLVLHGRYFGMTTRDAAERADEMLEVFDLTSKARNLANQLSGGMRRRLLLARALLHRPRLVIMDEPTAGVDIELRTDLWEYIRKLHHDGTTIVLTTHYLEEAEALCERVAFIGAGRITVDGTPDDLRQRYGVGRLEDVYRQVVGR